MQHSSSNSAPGSSLLVVVLGSLAIAFHLLSVVFNALAARSGPWSTAEGNMVLGPQFALDINETTGPWYLKPLKLTHNYHFDSNRPGGFGISVEVRLQDEAGNLLKTVRFPEADANYAVRYRQSMLAKVLTFDVPVSPGSEVIAAPGREVPIVRYWEGGAPGKEGWLESKPQHLVPRERQVLGPSEEMLLMAHAYARYLCRHHEAASAQIVRHVRESMPPDLQLLKNPPPEAFKEFSHNFGELPR